MHVASNRLHIADGEAVPFHASPNASGKLSDPQAIVIHFTAGRGFEQSIAWLCNPKAKASAHLIVARDGRIAQLVEFNRRSWHAGTSSWEGRARLNEWSIGVELDNFGRLTKSGRGEWRTYWGEIVPDDEVIVARHKSGGEECGWHDFPEAQVLAAYAACEALIDAFPSIDLVLGHDDVAPGRKADPGPAFCMDSFRTWLLGRGES